MTDINDTALCLPPMFCSNTLGGFECACPGGTEQAGGTCIPLGKLSAIHNLYACIQIVHTLMYSVLCWGIKGDPKHLLFVACMIVYVSNLCKHLLGTQT